VGDERMTRVKYGIVSSVIAALAIATAAAVLVVDRPTDQAGLKLGEQPIEVRAEQARPAASAPTATPIPQPGAPSTTPQAPADAVAGSTGSTTAAPTAGVAAAPTATAAPPAATTGAPPATSTPATPTSPSSPVVVDPAPAQPVGPGSNNGNNGNGKGHGKGKADKAAPDATAP